MHSGRHLLFSHESAADVELTTAQISSAVARAAKKAGISTRVSSHSARKGAAVLALLSDVPVVAIQGLGLWKCMDSLQAYLGRAIRENFSVLELVEGRAPDLVGNVSNFKEVSAHGIRWKI